MIDITTEQPVPLSVLARETPNRRGRRGVSISTVWRWVQRGSRGVRLETMLVGGIRMSSREALQRFFRDTTAAADGKPVPSTTKQRQRAIDAAERELADAGI